MEEPEYLYSEGKCLLFSDSGQQNAKRKGCADGGGEAPIRRDGPWADGSSELPLMT